MRIDNLTFGELKLIEAAVLKNYQRFMTMITEEYVREKYKNTEYSGPYYIRDSMNSMPEKDLDRKNNLAEELLFILGVRIYLILCKGFGDQNPRPLYSTIEMSAEQIDFCRDETTKHIFDRQEALKINNIDDNDKPIEIVSKLEVTPEEVSILDSMFNVYAQFAEFNTRRNDQEVMKILHNKIKRCLASPPSCQGPTKEYVDNIARMK